MGGHHQRENGPRPALRIHIASAHAILRQALGKLVHSAGHEVSDDLRADVAIVDLSGASAPYPSPPPLPTIALIIGGDDVAVEVLRAGYAGYLLQGSEPSELEKALTAVSTGENWAERKVVAKALTANDPRATPAGMSFESLTPREQEIFELITKGLSNRAIAERLGIAEKTVKGHASALYAKLGVKDRRDLILLVGSRHRLTQT